MGCSAIAAAASSLPLDEAATAHHLDLQAEPASAARAREFVEEHCSGDHPGRANALLLVSELVTNVVLHARTPMEVGVLTTADSIVVAVTDGCDDLPRLPDHDGAGREDGSDIAAEDGRGLFLMSRLATSWGVATRSRGKTVWCLLTTGADPPAGA